MEQLVMSLEDWTLFERVRKNVRTTSPRKGVQVGIILNSSSGKDIHYYCWEKEKAVRKVGQVILNESVSSPEDTYSRFDDDRVLTINHTDGRPRDIYIFNGPIVSSVVEELRSESEEIFGVGIVEYTNGRLTKSAK